MELNHYTITKEEEYKVLAQHLNILADSLTQDESEKSFQEALIIDKFKQEALHFLKHLI